MVAALKRAIAEREAEIVWLEYYDAAATDFSRPAKAIADYDRRHKALLEQRAMLEARDDEVSKQTLKRIEKLDTLGDVDFDAVLLPGRGQQLKAIASLKSFYDVDQPAVRLLGLSNWAQTANIEAEPSLSLSWCMLPRRAMSGRISSGDIEILRASACSNCIARLRRNGTGDRAGSKQQWCRFLAGPSRSTLWFLGRGWSVLAAAGRCGRAVFEIRRLRATGSGSNGRH